MLMLMLDREGAYRVRTWTLLLAVGEEGGCRVSELDFLSKMHVRGEEMRSLPLLSVPMSAPPPPPLLPLSMEGEV